MSGRAPLSSIASPLFLMGACLILSACSGSAPEHRSRPDGPLAERLAHADAADGRRIFAQCAACHNLSAGGGDRDGPNLWGVIGKPVATNSPRFAYTAALKAAGGVWTCARLDAWLADPSRFAPGTVMMFPGLPDGGQRADVIAYIGENGGLPGRAACPAHR